MRRNEPVTQREVTYSPRANILSTTRTDSSITYVSEDFEQISGFTQAELLGQSHNVVRHPDMPSEAFGDMWKALKAKRSWMGIVKNRCKNGDHYWVNAFATPVIENGKAVEYQSVRTKPQAIWVERAQALYAKLRNGKLGSTLKNRSLRRASLIEGGAITLAARRGSLFYRRAHRGPQRRSDDRGFCRLHPTA